MAVLSFLLVDDEVSLLTLLKRYLQRQGHQVTSCENGAAAIAACTSHCEGFDIAVVDVNLPDMNGHELAQNLGSISKRLRILLVSGIPDGVSGLPQDVRERSRFLLKPYTPSQLMKEVDELVGNSKPSAGSASA